MLQCVDSSTKKKRFSIICFHCQIVRSDEFPNSKWHTLEAGSYLVSEQSRENNHKKFPPRESQQFSASCVLSWLPEFKCSCFLNGLTPFQVPCIWPLIFLCLALWCLALLVYPELTHRAWQGSPSIGHALGPLWQHLFISSPGSCVHLCPIFAYRSIILPCSPASILAQAHGQGTTPTAGHGLEGHLCWVYTDC